MEIYSKKYKMMNIIRDNKNIEFQIHYKYQNLF
jgi:hypothetical protein